MQHAISRNWYTFNQYQTVLPGQDTLRTRVCAHILEISELTPSSLAPVITSKVKCVKNVQIRTFSGPYFSVFELNMKIYSVNLRVQYRYGKIRTRKNSLFG